MLNLVTVNLTPTSFRDTNKIQDDTNMTDWYACSHYGPNPYTVTEPQYLEITKDNLTHPYGQPPSAAELSLVDSAFFPASLLSS